MSINSINIMTVSDRHNSPPTQDVQWHGCSTFGLGVTDPGRVSAALGASLPFTAHYSTSTSHMAFPVDPQS